MSSLRRINSSRANGARSHGPLTPEGKARSSQNALRHGLLAQCVVVGQESRETFQDLLSDHLDRFGPLDGVEFAMLEEMAAAYWRMRRIWAIEQDWMQKEIDSRVSPDEIGRISDSFANLAETNKFRVLQRYENRMHRIYQRSLKTLLLLRAKNDQTNPVPFPDTCPIPDDPSPADSKPDDPSGQR